MESNRVQFDSTHPLADSIILMQNTAFPTVPEGSCVQTTSKKTWITGIYAQSFVLL